MLADLDPRPAAAGVCHGRRRAGGHPRPEHASARPAFCPGHRRVVEAASSQVRSGVYDTGAGTGVRLSCLANGERRPISEVREGDHVFATDPETGETGAREVLATMPHTDQLLALRTSAGDIITTEDHEYWNETDRAWQESQDLDPGDELLTADGDQVVVEGLDWSTLHTADAYDLDIADLDSYYVGAGDEAVLVHNCGPAERIANGHAFEKHVVERGEFPGIRTRAEFQQMIEDVMTNADEVRNLSGGRTAYWKRGTVVIENPGAVDGGTVFVPTNGYAYFQGLT